MGTSAFPTHLSPASSCLSPTPWVPPKTKFISHPNMAATHFKKSKSSSILSINMPRIQAISQIELTILQILVILIYKNNTKKCYQGQSEDIAVYHCLWHTTLRLMN